MASTSAAAAPENKMEKIKILACWDLGVVVMDPNHTIRQLKEKINRIERMRIHANGIAHPDHKTLRECEISDCTAVSVELLKSQKLLKVVVAYGGERIFVEVDDFDRISKLRYILEERWIFPIPEEHIFILNDRVMRNDQTFRSYRVGEGDVIRVFQGI